ncbi:MAG: SH3 domain-containing protein [Clostridia bacterium]|nr:SH3 domain-containing protein [Clostridia bacterium]
MQYKRLLSLVCLLLCLCCAALAEEGAGVVAKVTTPKGALNMRSQASMNARVTAEIPNGACLLVTEEGESWCQVAWNGKTGWCSAAYLTLLRQADPEILNYRMLQLGDKGQDVLAVKARLQELGYIRAGAELTDSYNDTLKGRICLFQQQTGMTADGVASQELQAYLFSDLAPVCTLQLPSVVSSRAPATVNNDGQNRVICGCCWGEGCECCGGTGWIYY